MDGTMGMQQAIDLQQKEGLIQANIKAPSVYIGVIIETLRKEAR